MAIGYNIYIYFFSFQTYDQSAVHANEQTIAKLQKPGVKLNFILKLLQLKYSLTKLALTKALKYIMKFWRRQCHYMPSKFYRRSLKLRGTNRNTKTVSRNIIRLFRHKLKINAYQYKHFDVACLYGRWYYNTNWQRYLLIDG